MNLPKQHLTGRDTLNWGHLAVFGHDVGCLACAVGAALAAVWAWLRWAA